MIEDLIGNHIIMTTIMTTGIIKEDLHLKDLLHLGDLLRLEDLEDHPHPNNLLPLKILLLLQEHSLQDNLTEVGQRVFLQLQCHLLQMVQI